MPATVRGGDRFSRVSPIPPPRVSTRFDARAMYSSLQPMEAAEAAEAAEASAVVAADRHARGVTAGGARGSGGILPELEPERVFAARNAREGPRRTECGRLAFQHPLNGRRLVFRKSPEIGFSSRNQTSNRRRKTERFVVYRLRSRASIKIRDHAIRSACVSGLR